MSLNFLGLGFNFGSKDSGLGKRVKKLTTGFSGMGMSFDKAADSAIDRSPKIAQGVGLIERAIDKLDAILTQNKLQTWLASFSLSKLGDISNGIKEIASGINLTTSLEGTMVANVKATKALGANFGYTGAAAKKFAASTASMAYGMNISTETAASATYAMDTYGDLLKAVGIDSKQTAAKVAEVFGVNTNELGSNLATLRKEFGFTDKQLSNVLGGMQTFGAQTGDMKGALSKMPELIEQVRKKATSLGKTLDAEELADYASQTNQLAAGFYAITNDSADAQKIATSISESLIEANVNIGKMFAGTEGDLSKFATGLGIATGDIDKAFKLMKKGPAGFVQGMAGMFAEAQKNGPATAEQLNFIQKQLMESMGPEAGQRVFEFFQKADKSTLQAMSSVKEATSSIGKLGKEAFSTGLTLQDSFDRAKDSFVMNFRSIARKEAVAFVKDTTAEFGKFTKNMKAVAAEGGPLGAIITKFSEMHQIGALALLPETLRPMAAVFGSMLSEASPLIGAMGSLGLRFSHLTNPLTLAIVGFGALAWSMKAAEKSALKADKVLNKEKKTLSEMERQNARLHKQGKSTLALDAQIADQKSKVAGIEKQVIADAKVKNRKQIGGIARAVVEKIGTFFAAIPEIFKSVWQTIKELWPEIGPPILSALKSAFEWLKGTALPALKNFAKALWHGIVDGTEAEGGGTASRIGSVIGIALRDGLLFAVKVVKDYLKGWWSKMTAIWSDGSTSFTDKIKSTMSNSGGIILGAFALAKFTPVFSVLGMLASGVGGVGKALVSVIPAIVTGVQALAGFLSIGALVAGAIAAVAALIAGFIFFPKATQKAVDAIGDFVQNGLTWLTEKLMDIAPLLVKYVIIGPLVALAAFLPRILDGVGSALKAVVAVAVKAVLGILSGIENWLYKKFPEAANVIFTVFEGIRTYVGALKTFIGGLIDYTVGAIKVVVSIVTTVVESVFKIIAGIVGEIISGIETVGGVLSDVGSGIASVFSSTTDVTDMMMGINSSSKAASSGVSELVKQFTASANGIVGVRKEAVQTFQTLQDLINNISSKGQATSAKATAAEAAKASGAITGAIVASEEQRYAALGAVQKNFANQSAAAMAGIPEAMKTEAARAKGELDRAYFEQLRTITNDTAASVEQRKASLASLEVWKIAKLNEYGRLVKDQQKLVVAGGDAASAQMADSMGKFSGTLTATANTAAIQASGAVGSVQKELGLSADSALASITNLAAINPEKFKNNLKKIKETFIQFSKDIAKAFSDAWTSALAVTNSAMASIDMQLTTAFLKLRGIVALMDTKYEKERSDREVGHGAQKSILAMGAGERDQELLNATNWPLWYDDYRTQFASLVMSVSSLSGSNPKGGRNSGPSKPGGTGGGIPNGTKR